MSYSEPGVRALLDADWQRLMVAMGKPSRNRKWTDAFSPRFAHIVLIRWAYAFHRTGWHRLGKLTSLLNFGLFGMEIPSSLKIGPGLIIPHTNGIILGAAKIGANVTIYQQVTLGAKMADWDYDLAQRPVVEDGATIAAGAKVLGPVVLGSNCVVGANAVVVSDVSPGEVVGGVPARVLSSGK
ncbi:serine O-acetyltransferase [Bradyrhizobium sp. 2TAF36]|uniref:serine O-acetyltransferase n=1 Tax=Bradyrhizobium sp. 2TAF36 TaxID=3233016 RepID=UPI003F912A5D